MDLSVDSREELEAESEILLQAHQILFARFRTGKHDDTASSVRLAAAELRSRARHPSRVVPKG